MPFFRWQRQPPLAIILCTYQFDKCLLIFDVHCCLLFCCCGNKSVNVVVNWVVVLSKCWILWKRCKDSTQRKIAVAWKRPRETSLYCEVWIVRLCWFCLLVLCWWLHKHDLTHPRIIVVKDRRWYCSRVESVQNGDFTFYSSIRTNLVTKEVHTQSENDLQSLCSSWLPINPLFIINMDHNQHWTNELPLFFVRNCFASPRNPCTLLIAQIADSG
jgi:hypothetical protein